MKFIVDTQLPPRLATFLSEKGHDSIHTTHFSEGHLLTDEEIIQIAQQQGRTVVTKDADFSDYFLLKGSPPKVLLIEFGNISNQELIHLFEQHLFEVITAFDEGSEMVIFNRSEVISY